MTLKKIFITRNSVAAGDDMDAPHTTEIIVDSEDKIQTILAIVQRMRYLPEISGGKATWSVATTEPIAVIAQEWTEPRLIVFSEYPYQGLPGFYNIEKLHFNYHAQDDPEIVFRVLQQFHTIEK